MAAAAAPAVVEDDFEKAEVVIENDSFFEEEDLVFLFGAAGGVSAVFAASKAFRLRVVGAVVNGVLPADDETARLYVARSIRGVSD